MKAIIIEDEKPAADKLKKAIEKADDSIEIIHVLDSVKTAVDWFREQQLPELIFMDIELSDGLCFKIFEQVPVTSPVIFTTAYDEYWQEAFEHSSIDYLLKPIKQEKLEAALKKYASLKKYFAANLQHLLQAGHSSQQSGYRKRFLVKRGTDFISVKTEDIAYFHAAHKLVCMVDAKGQKYILDQSLADIEKQLDPAAFYRVNRKYVIQMSAIRRIKSYPKSKLEVEVEPAVKEEIVISQENVSAFKDWMGQ
ncbi:MAG: LytTR family DNA-binding domain-containing protein [Chitinophagaceae bacterium]